MDVSDNAAKILPILDKHIEKFTKTEAAGKPEEDPKTAEQVKSAEEEKKTEEVDSAKDAEPAEEENKTEEASAILGISQAVVDIAVVAPIQHLSQQVEKSIALQDSTKKELLLQAWVAGDAHETYECSSLYSVRSSSSGRRMRCWIGTNGWQETT